MPRSKRKRAPKTILNVPDLEQSKTAVLNSLTSASSQRSYDHAIPRVDWYCSEPRLAINKTVVTRYRISLEQIYRCGRDPYSTQRSAPRRLRSRLATIRELSAVAEQWGYTFFLYTGALGGLLAGVARGLGIDGLIPAVPAIAGKKLDAGFFPQAAPAQARFLEQFGAEHYIPILATLPALNGNHHSPGYRRR